VRRVAIRLAGKARRARRIAFALTEYQAAGQVVAQDPDLQRAVLAPSRASEPRWSCTLPGGAPVAEVASILGCATPTAKVHPAPGPEALGALLGEESADVVGRSPSRRPAPGRRWGGA
jgi:hypothetical protein